ncbi:MAG: glycosyltransferase family 4 protein [Actinomycetota bacterium]|nr:glycosyltransferase family 4 protein [Actinomycetota bacterium]
MLLARLCFARARAVICNSEYLARAMAPYTRGKMVSIAHNPCTVPDPTFFGQEVPEFPDGGFRLLTVTNMNLRSKIQPLAEAISDWIPPELWEEMDLRWVICGSGSHEARLRALVRERGLDDRVRLLGRVENVPAAYEWCSVLVHPTRMDAFPNVPMEAMAHCKPVITNADSCGTREQVFDGENGFVVEDAGSFLAALRAYAADPKLREHHGRVGKLLVEREFSVEAQRRAMRRALERVVSRTRGGVKV